METKELKCIYLYPLYFDSSIGSSAGRRIHKSLAQKNPQAKDLLLATQSCGLRAELEKDKSHPKSLVGSGRIKVFNVSESKNQLLLKVAANLKVSPSSSASASANSNAVAVAQETVSPVSSTTSIQMSPNVIYQVRSKKKKRDRENK